MAKTQQCTWERSDAELTEGASSGVGRRVSPWIAHAFTETASLVEPPTDFTGHTFRITVTVRRTTGTARRRAVHHRAERI